MEQRIVVSWKDGREHAPGEELDPVARRNMERCAEFVARMIQKYGRKVLDEIEAEKEQKAAEDVAEE